MKYRLNYLEDKINKIEIDNKKIIVKYKILQLLLIILVLVFFVMGFSNKKENIYDIIKSECFHLVDKNGTVRIKLDAFNGTARQIFYNSDGIKRISLAIYKNDVSDIRFYSDKEIPRISITTAPKDHNAYPGYAGQNFYNRDGKYRRIFLGNYPIGESKIIFGDQKGNKRVQIATNNKKNGYINLFDTSGKKRIEASTYSDDYAILRFYDHEGLERMQMGTNPKRYTYQIFYDEDKHRRIENSINSDGLGIQKFSDNEGKLRIKMGTNSEGFSYHSFFSPTGETKSSTLVDNNGVIEKYIDKSDATKVWETTAKFLQVIDLLERMTPDSEQK
jgi:hypothetical protein